MEREAEKIRRQAQPTQLNDETLDETASSGGGKAKEHIWSESHRHACLSSGDDRWIGG